MASSRVRRLALPTYDTRSYRGRHNWPASSAGRDDFTMEPRVDRFGRLGGALFGIAMAGLGLVSLVRKEAVPDLEPLPASLPMRPAIAIVAALLLVVAGTALIANRYAARAAGVLGAVLSVWLVTLFVPQVVANP